MTYADHFCVARFARLRGPRGQLKSHSNLPQFGRFSQDFPTQNAYICLHTNVDLLCIKNQSNVVPIMLGRQTISGFQQGSAQNLFTNKAANTKILNWERNICLQSSQTRAKYTFYVLNSTPQVFRSNCLYSHSAQVHKKAVQNFMKNILKKFTPKIKRAFFHKIPLFFHKNLWGEEQFVFFFKEGKFLIFYKIFFVSKIGKQFTNLFFF